MTAGEWVRIRGDRDPRGHRGFRAVMPERLAPAKSPYGSR